MRPPVTRGRRRIVYLSGEAVLAVHAEVFGCTVQQARDRLRNPDGLEAAVVRPQNHAHYQSADLALQTAVLAHGIAEGQLFIEGNKRTALAAMATFLTLNDCRLNASQHERFCWMIDLSRGLSPHDLASRLRSAVTCASDPG
ncbi:MAG TPA: type II toxin-antitoxin system death-on-curing family toxin [Candidatus Dormibacteraeota bacterium]|nr:type II toxin-antitoxin system death-on-curing family toxin [Candidatus Dormibacteraeota bacterium]